MTNNSFVTVQVVPPTASDKPAWMDLWSQYNAFYGRTGDTALSQNVIDTAWTRLLDPTSPVAGLVATSEDGLVGLAHVVFHDNLIQLRQTCYMQDLFTSPAARGGGIARALINGVAAMCRERDVAEIYWHTQVENVVARRLYDQIGRDTNFIVYRMNAE